MDAIVFKNGLTDAQAATIAAAIPLLTGPGAESRLNFINELRMRFESKTLDRELRLDRNTATCFRSGILGAIAVQGRTDVQVDLLLSVAKILRIRSWIEFQKVEDHKAEFDVAEDTPFDGDPA